MDEFVKFLSPKRISSIVAEDPVHQGGVKDAPRPILDSFETDQFPPLFNNASQDDDLDTQLSPFDMIEYQLQKTAKMEQQVENEDPENQLTQAIDIPDKNSPKHSTNSTSGYKTSSSKHSDPNESWSPKRSPHFLENLQSPNLICLSSPDSSQGELDGIINSENSENCHLKKHRKRFYLNDPFDDIVDHQKTRDPRKNEKSDPIKCDETGNVLFEESSHSLKKGKNVSFKATSEKQGTLDVEPDLDGHSGDEETAQKHPNLRKSSSDCSHVQGSMRRNTLGESSPEKLKITSTCTYPEPSPEKLCGPASPHLSGLDPRRDDVSPDRHTTRRLSRIQGPLRNLSPCKLFQALANPSLDDQRFFDQGVSSSPLGGPSAFRIISLDDSLLTNSESADSASTCNQFNISTQNIVDTSPHGSSQSTFSYYSVSQGIAETPPTQEHACAADTPDTEAENSSARSPHKGTVPHSNHTGLVRPPVLVRLSCSTATTSPKGIKQSFGGVAKAQLSGCSPETIADFGTSSHFLITRSPLSSPAKPIRSTAAMREVTKVNKILFADAASQESVSGDQEPSPTIGFTTDDFISHIHVLSQDEPEEEPIEPAVKFYGE